MRLLLFVCIVPFLFSLSLKAQNNSSPLEPEDNPKTDQIGLMFGLGQNFQSGSYLVQCDDCIFEGGVGFGTSIGLIYNKNINDNFKFGVMGLYENMGIESSFTEFEPVQFQNAREQMESIDIEFRHDAVADFNYFTAIPFIAWTPTDWFFIRLGPSFSFVTSSTIEHTKILEQKIVELSTGETATAWLVDDNGNRLPNDNQVVEDGEFTEAESLVIGLNPNIGFNIPLSKQWDLAFSYMHNIPFTEVSSFGDNFRINSWRIFTELRFHLFKQKN